MKRTALVLALLLAAPAFADQWSPGLTQEEADLLYAPLGGGGGGSPCDAYPIGSIYISVLATNPATLLGCGTWSAFGSGRTLVSQSGSDTDFDVPEETGGAKTVASAGSNSTPTFTGTPFSSVINHTHTVDVTDPGHTHLTQRYPTATGSSSGFTIDTSMSGTLADNTLPTKSATTGVTASTQNPAGGVSSITPAGTVSAPTFTGSATSVVQPYIVVYIWKRTL